MATPMTKTDFDNAIEKINETAAKKILEFERVDKVVQAAVLAEREACAKLCESEGHRIDASWESCATAIRARGKK
jgi:hypothetical protein